MTLDTIGGAGGAWLLAALALGIAELLVPGVFLVFLALAAAITGVIALVLPDLPVAAQVGAFALWSALAVMIGRRWYSDYPVASDKTLNTGAARLVGDMVTVEVAIEHGRGRVRVGDGAWPARGPEMAVGTRARVIAVDGGTLVVQPVGVVEPAGD